jgi:malate dehydrogenase
LIGQVVKGYLPKDDGLKQALTGADIVVIPAGIPREFYIIEITTA